MIIAVQQFKAADEAAPELSDVRPMLNEKEVLAKVPVSRSTLRRMIKAGLFPPPVHLSPNRAAWFVDDITRWQTAIREHDPHFNPSRRRGKGKKPRRPVSANST